MDLAELIVRMTDVIMAGHARTASKAEIQKAREEVELFLKQNMARLVKWAEVHPGERPPVYHTDQGVIWLTRRQSRKLRRAIAKDQRLGRV